VSIDVAARTTPPPSAEAAPVAMEATGLRKRFGGVHALRGADMALASGRIHGLLGQNGSGKSTLLRILSGQIEPDAGELRVDGRPVRFRSPAQALAQGVAIVSQERALAPDLSVTENVCLARRERRRWHGVAWRDMRERATKVIASLGLSIDPDIAVGRLRPDEQQLVEIARAISTNARVLVLDEPTSSLTDDEIARLFTLLRALRERGVAIVLVTHRTSEVFDVVDEVTVLRDGAAVVAGAPLLNMDANDLVRLMTGIAPDERPQQGAPPAGAAPLLRVRGLAIPRVLDGVDLDVAAGEVVGVAGLLGSGRSELLGAIFGAVPAHGEIRVGDALLRPSPRRAVAAGIGYVPADRKTQGLALGMTLRDNIALARTSRRPRLLWPQRGRERAVAHDALAAFGIVASGTEQPAGTLSGGNQQKVLLAKWLSGSPRLLLLDEPTRGVDAAAKADIHRLLDRARGEGVALLVSSSEPSELRTLCDRVLVLHRGRVAAQLAGADVTDTELLRHAMG
jgi:ABC-type sugar transport system ATPase subunit